MLEVRVQLPPRIKCLRSETDITRSFELRDAGSTPAGGAPNRREAMTKPTLYLDVDGVLNSCVGNNEYNVAILGEDVPKSPFTRAVEPGETLNLKLRIADEIPGLLDQLKGSFDFVWATTWEHLANKHVGPLVGLPEIPYVEHSSYPVKMSFSQADWKLQGIENHARGPWAWVDDNAWRFLNRQEWPDVLILAPDSSLGLQQEHVDMLLEFAATHNN
jgi:hypothetical protein